MIWFVAGFGWGIVVVLVVRWCFLRRAIRAIQAHAATVQGTSHGMRTPAVCRCGRLLHECPVVRAWATREATR